MRPALNAERDARIVRLAETLTVRQIAEGMGLDRGVVAAALRRAGGQARKTEPVPVSDRDLKIVQMSRTMSVSQIAERIGLSRQTIYNILSRAGRKRAGRQGSRQAAPITLPAADTVVAAAPPAQETSDPAHLPEAEPITRVGLLGQRTETAAGDADWSASARAVIEAERDTCRFVFGLGQHDFAFCGKRATVVAAGQLTYCAHCAGLMRAIRARPIVARVKVATFSIRG